MHDARSREERRFHDLCVFKRRMRQNRQRNVVSGGLLPAGILPAGILPAAICAVVVSSRRRFSALERRRRCCVLPEFGVSTTVARSVGSTTAVARFVPIATRFAASVGAREPIGLLVHSEFDLYLGRISISLYTLVSWSTARPCREVAVDEQIIGSPHLETPRLRDVQSVRGRRLPCRRGTRRPW